MQVTDCFMSSSGGGIYVTQVLQVLSVGWYGGEGARPHRKGAASAPHCYTLTDVLAWLVLSGAVRFAHASQLEDGVRMKVSPVWFSERTLTGPALSQ